MERHLKGEFHVLVRELKLFTGLLGVGGWTDGSSGVLELFRKRSNSGDFCKS